MNYIAYQYGFRDWDSAAEAAGGYDHQHIIDTVYQAARKVMEGEAVYERDGVNFDYITYSWPLTTSLMYAAAHKCHQSGLRIIDIGGALGTSFQQNRRFIQRLPLACDWRIVEQPAFVAIGQNEFTNQHLRFFNTISDAICDGIDIALFGGSLCYLAKPYDFIGQVINHKPDFIIIDRTPVTGHDIDLFAVQHVPPTIYKASYAVRIFSYEQLVRAFGDEYIMIEQWNCDQQPDPDSISIGMLLQHRDVIKSHVEIP